MIYIMNAYYPSLANVIQSERKANKIEKEIRTDTIVSDQLLDTIVNTRSINDELFPAFFPLLGKWFLWLLRHL